MKYTINVVKSFSFLVLLAAGAQLQAADKVVWTSGGGTIWKSGGGLCWQAAFEGGKTCEPAPEPAPDGNFWADDSDFDGVVDNKDNCPFTPEGVAVDNMGCALDEDNDGVPDYLDACLGTPAGTTVNVSGCPVLLLSLTNITFETNSARLTDADKRILDDAISTIKASNSNHIDVIGHTDNSGAASYNQKLSEKRAQSVVAYLINNGVSSTRLFASGRGESEPIASNDTKEGRQKNRRVELLAR